MDLEPDEYFITDLIGLTVVSDQGAELGTLKDVLETGANDVYVVAMKDGKELMLPAIGDCILNVDRGAGTHGRSMFWRDLWICSAHNLVRPMVQRSMVL